MKLRFSGFRRRRRNKLMCIDAAPDQHNNSALIPSTCGRTESDIAEYETRKKTQSIYTKANADVSEFEDKPGKMRKSESFFGVSTKRKKKNREQVVYRNTLQPGLNRTSAADE